MNYNYTIPYFSSPVFIGDIPLGSSYPVRIQSMTNTDTLNTSASVEQCLRIIEAGADYVRLTAQGVREAENLAAIKKEIRKAGFSTPLIADIHFNPAAAETAARIVEKVRINPGNYADKRASFTELNLTENQYNKELERIHSRLLPLIKICGENKTVVRIGINHGSLSDRIMTRYGNTPEGMVASAMEFIGIFRSENFNNLVLSMKSSDTSVMIEATRQLAGFMQKEGLSYPLHLGVTEAGEGEDGRVRSAAGIGALLSEGIGDTIRVSLSENPEDEIPVAKKLAEFYPRSITPPLQGKPSAYVSPDIKPGILKRVTGPVVIGDMTSIPEAGPENYRQAGFEADNYGAEIKKTDFSADMIMISSCNKKVPENVLFILPFEKWLEKKESENIFPLFTTEEFIRTGIRSDRLNILLMGSDTQIGSVKVDDPESILVIFRFDAENEKYAPDLFFKSLSENRLKLNVILNPVFRDQDHEDLRIKSAALLGRYINDRRIAGISLSGSNQANNSVLISLAFSILQCTGSRITRTMYLSCPTCGRTKFNLQESVRKVKEATGHLKGLKIAIMGCIVNGPGEMAGADYGYVGAAPGKVHIYRGTIPVLKNIPEKDAVAELLRIIEQDHGSL
jgi:(E)-4-hydroxy-3-methylbut-2-enyl-diphosphate synthase